jgi:nitroreductase
MREPFRALLEAAARAPSGDNTQPWRFVVDEEAGTVALELDPTRDPSPMNAGQRMARIAVGAALENLVRAAQDLGWSAEPTAASPPALATVRLVGDAAAGGRVDEAICVRRTNRRPYDGRPVGAEVLDALARETPEAEGATTHWIVGADRLAALAEVIGRADAIMFGDPTMRRAFLANVRFDEPPGAEVAEGLSLASLELSPADRVALRVMRRAPDWLLRLGGASKVFAAKARQLVAGASGLCLVAARGRDAATDLAVGRALQRAWLALTARGLAAQPMMSLPVLDNALDHGDDALRRALGADRVAALLDEFRARAPEVGDGRPAWLLRFGFAPPPSGRTGRRPLEAVAAAPRPLPEGVA